MKNLPDFNRLVLAHLVGGLHHSGVEWHRGGYAFMVRWKTAEHTIADGWAREYYDAALAKIDADHATVERWAYLDDIRPTMVEVSTEHMAEAVRRLA